MAIATSFVKYLLFFFNLLCLIGGLILIIWGGLAYKSTEAYVKVYSPDGGSGKSINLALAIIIFGSIVLLVSFLGCCGAFKENKCMLMSYSVLLFVLLGTEIVVCFLSISKGGGTDLKKIIEKGFNESFPEYNNDKSIKKAWDAMQQNLKCCGKEGYEDWKYVPVPDSCCKKVSESCAKDIKNKTEDEVKEIIYTEGCEETLLEYLSEKNIAVGGIIIAFIQLLGIIFACCLAGRNREKSYNTH